MIRFYLHKFFYVFLMLLMVSLFVTCTRQQKPSNRISLYNNGINQLDNVIYCEKEARASIITLYEDSKAYEVEVIGGQIILFFKDYISHQDAVKIIEHNNAKVIAQIPYLLYYLIEVPLGEECKYVSIFHNMHEVEYVYPNIIENISAATSVVLDNYNVDHGKMVTAMIAECDPLMNITTLNISSPEDTRGINANKAIESIEKTLKNLEHSEGAVINMSFGPGLVKLWSIIPWQNRVLWNDDFVTEDNKYSYKRRYISGLKMWIKLVSKFDNKDFVIVKSAGNEGMKELETILDELMNQLSPKEVAVFEKHFIIVSAKDDNKEKDYPNDVSVYNKMITKVDISDMTAQSLHWQGTSFSSPRVVGYITKLANEYDLKVVDVLKHVRNVTKNEPNHILTYELLEREINQIKVKNKHITPNSEISNNNIEYGLVGTKWYLKHKSKLGSNNTHEEWEFMKNCIMKVTFYKDSEIKNTEYTWRYFYDSKNKKWKIWNMNCRDSRKKYIQESFDDINAEYINVYDYIHHIPQEDFYDYLHSYDLLNSSIYYCDTYLLSFDNSHLYVSNVINMIIHTLSKID